MPSELWPFFNVDRKLLNTICALAADVLLTIAKKTGVLPGDVSGKSFNQFLDKQYKKSCHIHCAKPSSDPIKDLTYLSRYTKKPPFANSRLKHYDGNDVIFQYLNHTTKRHNLFKCDVIHFITRLIQHIHEKAFA